MEMRSRPLEQWHAQQASAWIEVLRNPQSGDRDRFVAWLKESPRNVREFLLMLSLERSLEGLDRSRSCSAEALLAQLHRGHISRLGTPDRAPVRRRRWPRAAALAGVLLAAAALFLGDGGRASRWQTFATEIGEQRAFTLADGSIVHLNTHSRIAVRLGGERREVRLVQGEALFRVHHDAARPFLVSTDHAVVRAVGTEFDVYRRDDGTMVAVLEGRVSVTATAESDPASPAGGAALPPSAAHAASRSLSASEEARVSAGGSVSVQRVGNIGDAVAWRERRLVFQRETLEHIVLEFNRYRRMPIRLESAEVGARIYSGVFDADDADSLVQVLEHDPALLVEHSSGGTRVRLR
jgi:transmembrane sensor